jgi:adenylyl-sulfate kinase
MILQLTGLPGAGKTTLSQIVKRELQKLGLSVEVLDGDVLRKTMNHDLGFSDADRQENIRRLGLLAHSLLIVHEIVIIAAINPFEEIRKELQQKYDAKAIYIYCSLPILIQRDPKGLYKRAMLPDDDPQKIRNLTGIDGVYEEPIDADLVIDTEKNSIEDSSKLLLQFILESRH